MLQSMIQNTIIDFLDVPDLHEMMLTCRFYHQVCSSDAYWNKFTQGLLETFFDNVFVDRPNAPVPISQQPLNSTNMTTWLNSKASSNDRQLNLRFTQRFRRASGLDESKSATTIKGFMPVLGISLTSCHTSRRNATHVVEKIHRDSKSTWRSLWSLSDFQSSAI